MRAYVHSPNHLFSQISLDSQLLRRCNCAVFCVYLASIYAAAVSFASFTRSVDMYSFRPISQLPRQFRRRCTAEFIQITFLSLLPLTYLSCQTSRPNLSVSRVERTRAFVSSHCLLLFRARAHLRNKPSIITRPPTRRVSKNRRYSVARAQDDNNYSDKFARASTASACTCGSENTGKAERQRRVSSVPSPKRGMR